MLQIQDFSMAIRKPTLVPALGIGEGSLVKQREKGLCWE